MEQETWKQAGIRPRGSSQEDKLLNATLLDWGHVNNFGYGQDDIRHK